MRILGLEEEKIENQCSSRCGVQGWRKSEKRLYQDMRADLGPISREYANPGAVDMVRMAPNRPIG